MKQNCKFVSLVICLSGALSSLPTSFNVVNAAPRAPYSAVYAAEADEDIRTITLSKEGTLAEFIPKAERQDVVKLRIVGPMYYKDFAVLHSCPNLEYLDISLVTISDDGKGVANCIPENVFDGHETIKTVIFPKTLKAIGDYAFRGTTIESIELPESVDSLAAGVFQFCNNLTTINIPSGMKAMGNRVFCGDKSLEQITLSDNIEVLNEGAFQDCKMLKKINLPRNLRRVGYSAFNNTQLTEIHIFDKVEKIDGKAFADTELTSVICEAVTPPDMQLNSFTTNTYNNATLYIPEASMDDYLDMATWGQFKNVKEYTGTDNPEDPDGYTKITNIAGKLQEAMAGMQDIVKLRVLGDLNAQDFAFIRTLSALQGIDLSNCKVVDDGNGVANRLPDNAFEKMASLTDIKLPNTVNTIGQRVFAETGIVSIVVPESIQNMGAKAFMDAKALKEVIIANAQLNVPEMAFYGCSSLTSLVLPAECKEIAASAFANCTSLELLGLPSSLEVIGESAFANTIVKILGMGANVKSIAAKAFDNVAVTNVTCLAEVPPVLDASAFMQSVYDNATLKIVRAYEEAYKNNAVWSKFKNIELDNTPIIDKDGYVHIHCLATGDVEMFAPLDIVQQASKVRVTGIVDRSDFYYLSKLTNMEILDVENVKILATYDFEGNVKYEEDVFPENAFMGCKSIKQIKMPNDIKGVGSWAFAESSIEEIYIPKSVKEIGYQAFFYCKQLVKVIIDGEITTTPRSLFSQCSALKEVVLPQTLEVLNYETFYKCTSLENVELPAALTTIGEAAFENTSISHLVIPAKVNFIDKLAFIDSELEDLVCEGPAADAHLQSFTESQKNNLIVQVHEADIDSYLDHVVWSQFKHIVCIETGEDITGIENVMAGDNSFSIADGTLQLAQDARYVAVYDAMGSQLVRVNNVAAGQLISLPAVKGVMVVVIDGRSYKVLN